MSAALENLDRKLRQRRWFAPALLFAPLVLLAGLVQCSAFVRPQGSSTPAPVIADPTHALDGFAATIEAADGSKLVLRLGPLHADPQRQAFESQALRAHLGLGEGEPMRLVLAWQRVQRPSPVPRPAQNSGEGSQRVVEPLQDLPLALGLSGVRVVDGRGVALVSLDGVSPRRASAPKEDVRLPLGTLLAPPSGSLSQGECVEWHLWGRVPEPGARLEGLLPDPDSEPELALEFGSQTGLRGQIVLEPASWPAREWLRPLARLERKSPGQAASTRAAPAPSVAAPERDP